MTVSFGSDGKALILTRSAISDTGNTTPSTTLWLLDPASAVLTPVDTFTIFSTDLSVKLNQFPGQIIQASAGVSGDRNMIVLLAGVESDVPASSKAWIVIRYDVLRKTAVGQNWIGAPAAPRSVAVDNDGTNVMADWTLYHYINGQVYDWAQVPSPGTAFNIGTNAWDLKRNLIYSQIPAGGDSSVLHVFDTDNLTVRSRIQLPEDLAGKSVMSSDGNTL